MDPRLDSFPSHTSQNQSSDDKHKTSMAEERCSHSEGEAFQLRVRVHTNSESTVTPEATPTTPKDSAMAFVYPPAETMDPVTRVSKPFPKPAAAKTQHYGYSDEEILGWVFCSGTREAIVLRQNLGQQFKDLGEKLTEQITKDIPSLTQQMNQDSERKALTEAERTKRISSLGSTRKMTTSLSNLLDTNSSFKPLQSLKLQLQTAIAGDSESPKDQMFSEHLVSIAVATIRTRLGLECKPLPKLPPENPFEVDGFKDEFCVPVSIDFNRNDKTKLKPEKREKFLRNAGIGLCVAKQRNPESPEARNDWTNFQNDMYRSNLTIQIQLGDGTYLPVYNTAIHRGQLAATGSEAFASSEYEVQGVSSEAMNAQILETVSQIAFKLAPDSERVIVNLAHQGLGNEMFMATNSALKMDILNTKGSSEGTNTFVTYIDQNTVRVDVACAYDEAVTYQHSVVGKEKVDVDVVTSVLVKRQESEDGCETLWVPVSANIKVDAATSGRKISKKSRASGSSASVSSTQEQVDFGKSSPQSLSVAMSNLKRTTSDVNVHKVGLGATSLTGKSAPGFPPPLGRSTSHDPSSRLQVHPVHHRQNSGPVSLDDPHSLPEMMTPVGQSHIYTSGGSSATSTTSSVGFSTKSTGSSQGSLLQGGVTTSPPMSLSPAIEIVNREKLLDNSVRFEHKGQWYMASFDAEEFARRESRVGQYEKYFGDRLKECAKPPEKNPYGYKRAEVVRLSSQLNKLSNNYPCARLFADAKEATLRDKAGMPMKSTGVSLAQFSTEEVKRQMSGRAFDEVEREFAHGHRKLARSCLDEIAAYSRDAAAKMVFPAASVSKLKPEQVTALSNYVKALDESSRQLMKHVNEISKIHESRPQTEEEYRTFLKSLEDVKALTNEETDKIRWRNRFASKQQGSLLGVKAGESVGQQKPRMLELLEKVKLDQGKDQELIQYLEVKKQELLMAKQLCTFKTLSTLMESRPDNPELTEALHYDKCAQLIHGTDGSTREEIGVSQLLDADPSVDAGSLFEALSIRMVTVKPADDVASLTGSPEPEPEKHLQLQKEFVNR